MRSRCLEERVTAIEARAVSGSNPRAFAYARAVIAFGGGAPNPDVAHGFARWLERGGWR
jgi:hypothetical protein